VLEPEFLVSLYFDYLLDSCFLELPTHEAVNLHPGYLPYNRGFYYYVWAVLDGTPAGVSIQRLRPKVDTGDFISQCRVLIDPVDTGDVIYRKHEDEAISLFRATWPAIVAGEHRSYPQPHSVTRHRIDETARLAEIDPFERFRAIDLINRLRLLFGADGGACTIRLDRCRCRVSVILESVGADAAATLGTVAGGSPDYLRRRPG